MIPLAAGNKQLLETIFQSVFLSCHRRSSVGKYCGKHFFRSLIVSLSPLHAHCCRSVLPPRLCFQYSAQQSSAIWHRVHVQVFLWSADGRCDLGRQEDMYKNTGVLICPEFVETGAAQINRNVFYRQTNRQLNGSGRNVDYFFIYFFFIYFFIFFIYVFIGFDCNIVYVKKPLDVFSSLFIYPVRMLLLEIQIEFFFSGELSL